MVEDTGVAKMPPRRQNEKLQVESHFDPDEPASKKVAVAKDEFRVLHDRSARQPIRLAEAVQRRQEEGRMAAVHVLSESGEALAHELGQPDSYFHAQRRLHFEMCFASTASCADRRPYEYNRMDILHESICTLHDSRYDA